MSSDAFRQMIFEGRSPDYVLVKTYAASGVAVTTIAASPLSHMRFQGPAEHRLDEAQYQAGLRFLADYTASAGTSNTAAVCETASRLKLTRAEQLRKDEISAGRLRLTADGRDDSGPIGDPEKAILARIASRKAYDRRLEAWERQLLSDFLIAEMPVSSRMSARWGIDHRALATLIRITLWKLAKILEQVDKAFAVTIAASRVAEAG